MAAITITIPADFEREPLADRMRWWAKTYLSLPDPNLRMVALLQEGATEVELGQRTALTDRSHD